MGDPRIRGLEIGVTIEGTDEEVDPIRLEFPITEEELDQAYRWVTEEAMYVCDPHHDFCSYKDHSHYIDEQGGTL